MQLHKQVRLFVFLIPLLFFSACTSRFQQTSDTQSNSPVALSYGGEVKDTVSFIDALRSKGIEVTKGELVEQPFLKPKGTQLRLSGGSLLAASEVQSFNYDDTDLKTNGIQAAQEDTAQIEPNGNPKTSNILWIAGPHWYRKERLVVLYAGDDAGTLSLLESILGKQFAGK